MKHSTHGFQHETASARVKYLWRFLFCLSCGFTVFLVRVWRLRPTVFLLTLEARPSLFPEVTICSRSKLPKSKTKNLAVELTNFHDYYYYQQTQATFDLMRCRVCWIPWLRYGEVYMEGASYASNPSDHGHCFSAERAWTKGYETDQACIHINGTLATFTDKHEMDFALQNINLYDHMFLTGYVQERNPCRSVHNRTGKVVSFLDFNDTQPDCRYPDFKSVFVIGARYSLKRIGSLVALNKFAVGKTAASYQALCMKNYTECEAHPYCMHEKYNVYDPELKLCRPRDEFAHAVEDKDVLDDLTATSATALTQELVPYAVEPLSEEILGRMRFLIDEIFTSCRTRKTETVPCTSIIRRKNDTGAESCFSVNTGWQNATRRTLEQLSVIELELNTTAEEYQPFEDSEGYVLHLSQIGLSHMDARTQLGVMIGYKTQIRISYVVNTLLKNCVETKNDQQYTAEGCLNNETSQMVVDRCNCSVKKIAQLRVCTFRDRRCVLETTNVAETKSGCFRPCEDVIYVAETAFTKIRGRRKTVLTLQVSKKNEAYTENFANDLLSDVGGLLAMAAGMSCISYIELLVSIVNWACRRLKGQ